MLVLALVPVLFILFYVIPGVVLLSNSAVKGKRLENFALAILLSLLFAPLTFKLLSRAFPGNDSLLLAGFICFWALAAAGVRFFPQTIEAWLPDISALPKADRMAWLFSTLLAAIVVALRLGVLQGNVSQIDDDLYHLTKVTSIATTGLPSLYARQPLYPFAYYDLDYISPALWFRYSRGTVGIGMAWVIHIGVQAFVTSLFLTRLMYMFARSRMTRLFGLLALYTATGLDLLFLPWLLKGHRELGWLYPQLDLWSADLNIFDGFMQISMPITIHVWVPQHQLGLSILGLIFLLAIASPHKGISRTAAIALLLATLFLTSPFAFLGTLPGLALWYIYKLWTEQDRLRQLLYLAIAAFVALVLLFPTFADFSDKKSYLDVGLRSFAFLDVPVVPWLKYPITALVYLFLESGIPFVMLLWLLLRPSLRTGSIRFWVFIASGLLIPFFVQSSDTNDIAMRGVLPAQLSLVVIGCYALTQLEAGKRSIVYAVVIAQSVLSLSTVGAELYFRSTDVKPPIPSTTRWIADHTPLDSLVFYELSADQFEVNYGYRMSYTVWHRTIPDQQYTPFPSNAWSCLPEVDLYNENSLCTIEALVPGAQPVYVKYAATVPELDSSSFTLEYQSKDSSVFSLACPKHEAPQFSEPPIWTIGPYLQYHALLPMIPRHHFVAATTNGLIDWLKTEGFERQIHEVVLDLDGGTVDRQTQLNQQLRAIDELSSPVWLLLDYTLDHLWNEQVLSHVLSNYYVAQTNTTVAQWMQCKQRFVLALPASGDEFSSVHDSINFGDKLVVSEWRVGSRSYQPGEVLPMELAWSRIEDGHLNFFVHLLDRDWKMFAQIDLSAAVDGTLESQLTRMGLYLPPDLPAGEYQIRLGVYRANDGQRLTLPTGEDSIHIPFTVTR